MPIETDQHIRADTHIGHFPAGEVRETDVRQNALYENQAVGDRGAATIL